LEESLEESLKNRTLR